MEKLTTALALKEKNRLILIFNFINISKSILYIIIIYYYDNIIYIYR